MAPRKRPRAKHDSNILAEAIAECKAGNSVRRTAEKHGIPRSTLSDYLTKGRIPGRPGEAC